MDRLILDYGDRVVKGYADRRQWSIDEDRIPARLSVLPLGSSTVVEMSLEGVKAVSFVKSFEGIGYEELRFHDHLAPAECLWVRLTFTDGEILEGMIRNGHDHVLRGGFYMSPADQQGNSWMIYVFKHKLREFQVLGLRPGLKVFSSIGRRAAPPMA